MNSKAAVKRPHSTLKAEEVEAAVSRDCVITLQPKQQFETPSQKKDHRPPVIPPCSQAVSVCPDNSLKLLSEIRVVDLGPGMVAHVCNSSTLGGQSRQGQGIETILANTVKPGLYLKKKKLAGHGPTKKPQAVKRSVATLYFRSYVVLSTPCSSQSRPIAPKPQKPQQASGLTGGSLTPVIPALWEAEVGRSQGQEFETSLANMVECFMTVVRGGPDTVAQACNPSTLGGWGGKIARAQEFKTKLGNRHLGRSRQVHHKEEIETILANTVQPRLY
ncbi:hypothetical protein AAY473_009181 [Plecturocebus cupreus]